MKQDLNLRFLSLFFSILLLTFATALPLKSAQEPQHYDVVIYGGTSAGVVAAIQVVRMGQTAILLEPGTHLGGLSSGGLGATDIGNKRAIGGIAREFYQRIKHHYQNPENWKFESLEHYRNGEVLSDKDDALWMFEPHVAEKIFGEMIAQAKVDVVFNSRLNRKAGVILRNKHIQSVEMVDGRVYRGRMFIDATYEGDLMAAAGVSYTIGRESNAKWGETLNGIQVGNAIKHQLQNGIDPFIVQGNPASGLLPHIEPTIAGEDGTGDHRVQAYNLRICATKVPENRIPFDKPDVYDPLEFELLLRNFEAGESRSPWNPLMMPNRKTDANNNFGFSTDYLGMSYQWAEADDGQRQIIFREHVDYTRGLLWTLANSPRVPSSIRKEFSEWGLCRDEFSETGGLSHQLYVREARRMISAYVMSQHDCQGRRRVEDSIGLAAYTMDSHNVQRYVDANGFVRNEGDVQVGGFSPYPISYRSVVPLEEKCQNLFVPVCLSSTHIAFGSIRMEPVFMVLGQSCATAACQANDNSCAVQQLNYGGLRKRLLLDGQILDWSD